MDTTKSVRWFGTPYVLITLAACVFAFVGLSASSFWTDELFTLYVIQHADGLGEVLRRALTDVHPPLYYMFLYEWSRLVGYSEWILRLPTAVFFASALALFWFAASRVVANRAAVWFACALASLSPFWFEQTQYTRSYGLAMLLAALLLHLAIAMSPSRAPADRFPWAWLLTFTLVGAAASFTHAYLLLAFGMVLLYLLFTVPNLRLRMALVASGALVLACNAGYYYLLTKSTRLDFDNLWFRNDLGFFLRQFGQLLKQALGPSSLAAVVVIGIVWLWRWRRPVASAAVPATAPVTPDRRWAEALCIAVLVGIVVAGIGVSIAIKPSFSYRNVLVAAPFIWLLFACLYDSIEATLLAGRGLLVWTVLVVLVSLNLVRLGGRVYPRTEEWRQSARFVEGLPGCTNEPVPAVFPYSFAAPTPAIRNLFSEYFYGHYFSERERLRIYEATDFVFAEGSGELSPLLAKRAREASTAGACHLLAWSTHMVEPDVIRLAMDLARQPAFQSARVEIQELRNWVPKGVGWGWTSNAYVLLVASQDADLQAESISYSAGPNVADSLGDRWSVRHVSGDVSDQRTGQVVDTYSVQRVKYRQSAPSNELVAVPRYLCRQKLSPSSKSIWPGLGGRGCYASRGLPDPSLRFGARILE